MTEPTSDLLERLDATSVPPAPLDDIVRGGRSLRTRRRRTAMASAAAAVLLVTGGGAAATQAFHDAAGDAPQAASDPNGETTPFTAKKLDVDITYAADLPDEPFLGLPGRGGDSQNPRAVFDSDTGSLIYLSPMSYSGSCAPVGRATIDDEGHVGLTLTATEPVLGGGACTADAQAVLATISGLDHKPRSLTVTEGDATREVPVGQ